ncbi:MAG: DUF4337 domain-containing protein [Chthoniobacteraceae bacterium]
MENPEVPMEQVHEHIEHHAEGAKEKWVSMVALSTAVLAALAAVCSMLAGGHANEAMVSQIKSSDQWNFYQAKGIKAGLVKTRIELLSALEHGQPDAAAQKLNAADEEKLKQYDEQQADIKKEADDDQKEAATHLTTHEILSRGVTMFQIAIAVGAISVLTKKQMFWAVSLLFGLAGVFFFIQGLLTH